jgi:hypothetical protein
MQKCSSIKGGSSYKDEKGILNILLYFDISNSENLKFVPKEDVATVSIRFFKALITLIGDAYKKYGLLSMPPNSQPTKPTHGGTAASQPSFCEKTPNIKAVLLL